MNGKVKALALVGSLDFETVVFEREVAAKVEQVIGGVRFVSGRLFDRTVVVVRTGGGKINAAIATTLLIEHFNPQHVIFTGVAGAIRRGLTVGDVVIGERSVQHDFGETNEQGFTYWRTWNPLSGEDNPMYFPGDPYLLSLTDRAMATVTLHHQDRTSPAPKIIKGVIATGDMFCGSRCKKLELRERLAADAVEMDGAAVAQVCWHHGLGCLIMRGVSDGSEGAAYDEYDSHRHVAMTNAALLTTEIVKQYDYDSEVQKAAQLSSQQR